MNSQCAGHTLWQLHRMRNCLLGASSLPQWHHPRMTWKACDIHSYVPKKTRDRATSGASPTPKLMPCTNELLKCTCHVAHCRLDSLLALVLILYPKRFVRSYVCCKTRCLLCHLRGQDRSEHGSIPQRRCCAAGQITAIHMCPNSYYAALLQKLLCLIAQRRNIVCCVQVVCEELGIDDLGEVFEWIDLDKPIGSASISQVGYTSATPIMGRLMPV